MNRKIILLVIGGVLVSSVAFGVSSMTNAAEKNQTPAMVQSGHMMESMDAKAMADRMNSPQMQEQCAVMMQSPEMQQAMKNMLQTPQMQSVMKQMLQQDMGFHQVMSDLVNSVDMSSDHSMPSTVMNGGAQMNDHNSHHGN
ncbi:hypothetical protein [Anaerospora sp.]|jgi:hypothetical protein|uniref:hypothetical protein n=1 Tax=Anaerospora sp. TaxID=1960278 RepID=UPI002896D47C|nr:hypothetical protein [Anaerospora sp.]